MKKTVMSYIPTWLIVLLKSYLVTFAFMPKSLVDLNHDYPVKKFFFRQVLIMSQSFEDGGIVYLFLLLAVIFMLVYSADVYLKYEGYVSGFCVFAAITTVIGRSYMETASWNYFWGGKLQVILAIIVGVGYYNAYKLISKCVVRFVSDYGTVISRMETSSKIEWILFEKHPFVANFILLSILSLPYLLFLYPGTIQADAAAHIMQYYGDMQKNNMSPIAVTLIWGAFFDVGNWLGGNDNAGLFLYTITQFLAQTAVFSYSFCLAKRLSAPMCIRWIMVFWYGIVPVFPNMGYLLVKDSGYYILIFLFVLSMMEEVNAKEDSINWRRITLMVVGAIGASLYRNNGKLIVIPSLVFACLLMRKRWKQYIMVLVSCLLVLFVFDRIYVAKLNCVDGPIKENLSLVLQMTGRYVKEYGEEITEEEREVLTSVFACSSELTEIVQEYGAELSDGVKNLFKDYPTKQELRSYWEVWFSQGLKHPDAYVQALLNQTYGYFYIPKEYPLEDIGVYKLLGREHLVLGDFEVKFIERFSDERVILWKYSNMFKNIPIIGLLNNASVYIYSIIGMFLYLLARRNRKGIVAIIPSLCMLFVVASPVNACFRYVLPLVVSLPMNLIWCFYRGKQPGENRCA